MKDEKYPQPVVGKIELATTPSRQESSGPGKVLQMPTKPQALTPIDLGIVDAKQFEKLRRTILVGLVTNGFLSNGGNPCNPTGSVRLKDLIATAEGLL